MMKNLIFTFVVFISSFIVISCKKTIEEPIDPEKSDPVWIKVEIPTGRETYGIAGNIDKTLLVTTWTKAYYTHDQGKIWKLSKDFQGPIIGLFTRNDTVFAMPYGDYDSEGNTIANGYAGNFTTDLGLNWYYNYPYFKSISEINLNLEKITSPAGINYRIKRNKTPVSPGSSTYYVNPSDLLIKDAKSERKVYFPFTRDIKSLYLDSNNRLYVAVSGGTYQPETNSFYCCTPDMPAVIYVSRYPLPQ